MLQNKKILNLNLKHFLKNRLKSKIYFAVIYGSYAYNISKKNSDVDILVVSEHSNKKDIDKFTDFVISLHHKFGLGIDNEVPFHKKLILRKDLFEKGIKGGGFSKRNGMFFIPKIKKTRRFLSSKKVVMRLVLNVLTTKNIFIMGDYNYYKKKRLEAAISLVRIIFSARNISKCTVKDFIDMIFKDKVVGEGEFYLGYKDIPIIRRDLLNLFGNVFNLLVKKRVLIKKDEFYLLPNKGMQ